MSLDALESALPEYAGDLRRNLGSVIDGSGLAEQALWGTVLAVAIACRSAVVLRELEPEARSRLSPRAYTAAKTTAAVTGMNNVFHRTRHLLSDPAYGGLRAGLRTDVLGDPGVRRADAELWSLAVSAVNACGRCLDAHEQALREAGLSRESVQEAVRIAAVLHAVSVTLDAEQALAGG